MLHGKASLLLPALILYAVATEAATREEVERFTATQLPGSVQVCRGEGILKAGEHRMTFMIRVLWHRPLQGGQKRRVQVGPRRCHPSRTVPLAMRLDEDEFQ